MAWLRCCLLLVVLCAARLAVAEDVSFTPEEKRWLEAHPTIVVGTYREGFAPFESVAKDQVQGLAPDYLAKLGRTLGIKVTYRVYPDWAAALNAAKAWVLLRHIQADPLYRDLVDAVINPIKPQIERKDPGLYYRAGWIFSASPNTATPFHIDRSHVLLLQVRGTKTVYVWDPDDTAVCSERARDCFHLRHDLSRTLWHEEFRSRAHVFQLGPGMGVYMPLTSPHMVETSNEASTTISFTYNTDATRRNAKVHVMREMLYRLGMTPPDVGKSHMFDHAALAAASAIVVCRGPGGHPPACPSLLRRSAYAVAD